MLTTARVSKITPLCAIVASLAVAGCGSSSDSDPSEPPTQDAADGGAVDASPPDGRPGADGSPDGESLTDALDDAPLDGTPVDAPAEAEPLDAGPGDAPLEAEPDASVEDGSADASIDAGDTDAATDTATDTTGEDVSVDDAGDAGLEASVEGGDEGDGAAPVVCTGALGFSANGTAWSLPGGYAGGFYSSLEGGTYCDSYNGYGRPAYTTLDLTGDGDPDFLVTKTCNSLEGADPDVGKTKWLLYANDGTGFGEPPADWALPGDYANGFYSGTSGDTYCDSYNGYGRPAYELRDMNGDGRLDFLVTKTCSSLSGSDPDVGKTKWRVYWNNGGGFDAAPADWALPQDYANAFYSSTSGDTYCDSYNGYGRPAFQVRDMDGDAKPDFVVTKTCPSLAGADPDVGKLKWLVYRNTTTGFEAAPTEWPLPQDYAQGFYSTTEGDTYCDSYNGYGRPAYATVDLTGDAKPDFLVTKTCNSLAGSDPDVGKLYWRLYENTGTGFAASPATWSLPQGYAKGFYSALSGDTYCDSYNGYGRPAYATVDLDDDQRPEFVVLDTCASLQGSDPGVGVAYWLLYENTGAGFSSTADQWCLPEGYAGAFYHALSGNTYCDSYNGYGRPAYSTLPLTGAGRMDFVVTKTCNSLAGADPEVGKTKWVTY